MKIGSVCSALVLLLLTSAGFGASEQVSAEEQHPEQPNATAPTSTARSEHRQDERPSVETAEKNITAIPGSSHITQGDAETSSKATSGAQEAVLTDSCEKSASPWSPWTTKAENIKTSGCGVRRRTRSIRDQELAAQCNIPLVEYIDDCDTLTKKEKLKCLQYYFVNDVFGKTAVVNRQKRFDPSIFDSRLYGSCPDDITKRKVDFLVMVDKSGGLSRGQFRQLLRSVEFLVKKAIPTISQETTRMALMTFANTPQVEFHLNQCDNKTCVLSFLRKAEFTGGLTRMATALQEAEHVFDVRNGMRECSRRVVLLFTDGTGGRYEALTPEVPALNLKVGKGVEIFAIGMTELISEEELTQIVSSPSLTHLFYMDTVKQTRRIFRRLKAARDNDSAI